MRCRAAMPLFLAATAGGCTPLPSISGENARMDAALVQVAEQVRRCYRPPRAGSLGREIVTRVRVRLTADGQLANLPFVVFQGGVTPANRPYADQMAQAAIAAVLRCTPMRQPESAVRYGWSEFELTFSPTLFG